MKIVIIFGLTLLMSTSAFAEDDTRDEKSVEICAMEIVKGATGASLWANCTDRELGRLTSTRRFENYSEQLEVVASRVKQLLELGYKIQPSLGEILILTKEN